MKITREGNTFTIEVRHGAHAETLDALLRVIALTLAGPSIPDPLDPDHRSGSHPVSGLTLTLGVNPWQADPWAHVRRSDARTPRNDA